MAVKKIISLLLFIFSLSSLHSNKWFDIAYKILKENPEPQLIHWIDFFKENTNSTKFETNKYNEHIFKTEKIEIAENFSNDNGDFSHSGVKVHSYSAKIQNKIYVLLVIDENNIRLKIGQVTDKNRFIIVSTINHNKHKTVYEYGDDFRFE